MNKRNAITLIVSVSLFPTLLFAQLKKDTNMNMAQALTQPTKMQSIVGLLGLNPNKFSMSHSYSLEFTSFGGQAFNRGLYLNTMQYQFSDPITMYLQIGMQHQPFGSQVENSPYQSKVFVSGAGLQYKPSDNFKVQLEYSEQPGLYYSPYYHRDRFYQNRSPFDEEAEDNQ